MAQLVPPPAPSNIFREFFTRIRLGLSLCIQDKVREDKSTKFYEKFAKLCFSPWAFTAKGNLYLALLTLGQKERVLLRTRQFILSFLVRSHIYSRAKF